MKIKRGGVFFVFLILIGIFNFGFIAGDGYECTGTLSGVNGCRYLTSSRSCMDYCKLPGYENERNYYWSCYGSENGCEYNAQDLCGQSPPWSCTGCSPPYENCFNRYSCTGAWCDRAPWFPCFSCCGIPESDLTCEEIGNQNDCSAFGCDWDWVVDECAGTETNCGIYPDCENCHNLDGCYFNDGVPRYEYRDYYCQYNENCIAEGTTYGCSSPGGNPFCCSSSCGAYGTDPENIRGCGDGIDNDCDGSTDCFDPDCISDPACGGSPFNCNLVSASISGSGCPGEGCYLGDSISMTGTFYGNCRDYPELFFQIDATDDPEFAECVITYSGGHINGINSNPLISQTGNQMIGTWVIPGNSLPPTCFGKTIYARNAKLYDTEGEEEISFIAGGLVSGTFTFANSEPEDCDLTSARWEVTEAVDGDSVNIILEGTNCEGQTISFEVRENDHLVGGVGDDPVRQNPESITFGASTANWIAEWQDDGGFPESNPPEYYFKATVVSTGEVKKSTNELQVEQGGVGPGVNCCSNYSSQLTCEAYNPNIPGKRDCVDENFPICGGDIECYCRWDVNENPKCDDAWIGSSNGNGIGSCSYNQETDNDCSDGWLNYSVIGTWTWNETNQGYNSQSECEVGNNCIDEDCCTQRYGEVQWHYDPTRLNEDCKTTTNTVPCSSQVQLPFFTFTNIIGVVILIALIYFFMNYKKKKKK